MRNTYTRRVATLGILLAACGTAAVAQVRPYGDSKVVAPVPAPGYPEGIAVRAIACTFPDRPHSA